MNQRMCEGFVLKADCKDYRIKYLQNKIYQKKSSDLLRGLAGPLFLCYNAVTHSSNSYSKRSAYKKSQFLMKTTE